MRENDLYADDQEFYYIVNTYAPDKNTKIRFFRYIKANLKYTAWLGSIFNNDRITDTLFDHSNSHPELLDAVVLGEGDLEHLEPGDEGGETGEGLLARAPHPH